MNLTDEDTLKFLRGTPVLFNDICAVYPAKLGEIVDMGYTTFQQYLSILTADKPINMGKKDDELGKMMEEITGFQYLLMLVSLDIGINQLVKDAFLFFTHENVVFSVDPPRIAIGPLDEQHLLTEENFYHFQTLLRRMYFLEQDGEEIIINPDDPYATKKLKQQMIINRAKVRKAKAAQAAREGTDLKFSDLIASLTINHCNLNIENIWNITYYAFHDQLKRMGWRDQFNINNQAALAGAKLKKSQMKHWMRSIASSDKS